jgi:hypothetical protein
LYLMGREDDSQAARAVAADLADSNRSTLGGENPFLKGVVQFALRLAWEAQQPQEPAASPGLVGPPGEGLLIRR